MANLINIGSFGKVTAYLNEVKYRLKIDLRVFGITDSFVEPDA